MFSDESKSHNDDESSIEHKIRELEQEKTILDETNEILSKKVKELAKSKNEAEKKLGKESKKSRELEQEKIILEEISQYDKKRVQKFHRKYYVTIAMISIVVAGGFVTYSYYENQILQNYQVHVGNYNSPFLIQNLRGDVVNTYVSWNIATGTTLTVDIINQAGVTPDKLFAVKDAILSKDSLTLANSLLDKTPPDVSAVYYKGWKGALVAAASKNTAYFIPQQFTISDDPNGAGDIIITLTNDLDPDGLSGFTRDVADGNQILKATITIYNANELSPAQLGAITRHEFGHAMGLAHSTAPEDLMHATIQSAYPYISSCDIDAVTGLYNGDKQSQVICQN